MHEVALVDHAVGSDQSAITIQPVIGEEPLTEANLCSVLLQLKAEAIGLIFVVHLASVPRLLA